MAAELSFAARKPQYSNGKAGVAQIAIMADAAMRALAGPYRLRSCL
jgi:hypothetical protein